MRVALVVSLLVGAALIIFILGMVINKSQRRRKELSNLVDEVATLQSILGDVKHEVQLQEDAGYSDVSAFRHIFNTHPEVLS